MIFSVRPIKQGLHRAIYPIDEDKFLCATGASNQEALDRLFELVKENINSMSYPQHEFQMKQ